MYGLLSLQKKKITEQGLITKKDKNFDCSVMVSEILTEKLLGLNIEGFRSEWCISSMIYSRDTPFWLGTLDIIQQASRVLIRIIILCMVVMQLGEAWILITVHSD